MTGFFLFYPTVIHTIRMTQDSFPGYPRVMYLFTGLFICLSVFEICSKITTNFISPSFCAKDISIINLNLLYNLPVQKICQNNSVFTFPLMVTKDSILLPLCLHNLHLFCGPRPSSSVVLSSSTHGAARPMQDERWGEESSKTRKEKRKDIFSQWS